MPSRAICEYFYSYSQYRDIHWVFLVPKSCYPHAVDPPGWAPSAPCFRDEEPGPRILLTLSHAGNARSERISKHYYRLRYRLKFSSPTTVDCLTLSERKVLCLLGKGWGINQIAALLKSNKTISAQNSAMLFYQYTVMQMSVLDKQTVFVSRELNPPSVYGETMKWKQNQQEKCCARRKCVMSTIGIKGLFDAMPDCRHTLHIFQNHPRFIRLR